MCWFPRHLCILMGHRPSIPQKLKVFPNKKSGTRISRRIPKEAMEEAVFLWTDDSKIKFITMEQENSNAKQFRSFIINCNRDSPQQQRCMTQLSDTNTTVTILKESADHIQQIQIQLSHMSLQLQKSQYLCIRCQQTPSQAQIGTNLSAISGDYYAYRNTYWPALRSVGNNAKPVRYVIKKNIPRSQANHNNCVHVLYLLLSFAYQLIFSIITSQSAVYIHEGAFHTIIPERYLNMERKRKYEKIWELREIDNESSGQYLFHLPWMVGTPPSSFQGVVGA